MRVRSADIRRQPNILFFSIKTLDHLSALLAAYFCRNVSCREGGAIVKRVKAACIFQTLVFSQKPEYGYSKEQALKINHDEIEHYKVTLDRSRVKYQIDDQSEQEDGSIVLRIRKQYNDRADVSEYFK